MLRYRESLKLKARSLRRDLTEAEKVLWNRLRMKQVQDVQFLRQRPIGNYIVDFYAPQARIVIEVDGSQHTTDRMARRDKQRDDYLTDLGLLVLRFPDSEVLRETESVMEVIFRRISERCFQKSPHPPFRKGGPTK
jgi:very-short-patch-repair endonuclease